MARPTLSLFQYQQKAEPPAQEVLNPVAWLAQAVMPQARRVLVSLLGTSFAFTFISAVTPVSSGGGDDKIILGQKETMAITANPHLGGGALFG